MPSSEPLDPGEPPSRLMRVLGLPGAVVVGVGAMLGTGVFVAWTPAYDVAGPWLLAGLAIAAAVSALNASSTARLAARLPVAGGAYAYGRAHVSRAAGVLAGYAFTIGKSASAGAAGLAIGAYVLPGGERAIAVAAIGLALALDLRGITRSVRATAVGIVLVVAVLAVLVLAWWVASPDAAFPGPPMPDTEGPRAGPIGVLAAGGFLFVAFAGYARITVLGEEVRSPRRTIPRAVAIALAITLVVYAAVGATVVAAGGGLGAAPLEALAEALASPALQIAVRIAAVLAAGAALLSLIAGVGRTVFAMASGADAPRGLAAVSGLGVPYRAELLAAGLAVAVALMGGIAVALALSAVTVLTYYGVAHVSAWRAVPGVAARVVAAAGLAGCVLVAGSLVAAALLGATTG